MFAAQLAAYFCSDGFRRLDAPTLARIKPYALDSLAVALAGSQAASSRTMADAILDTSAGSATVFGTGRAAALADAALLNGAAAHALELDDDHRVAVLHPGAVVVPAAFALAEARGSSGTDFLRAVLAGYEVAVRVGLVFRGSLFEHGLHPTPICGAFGAAAAGAVLLRLDADGFARALGIAGTQAAGSTEWQADGSWIKRLNTGHAARAGVTAALLAAKGFTAPASIFEGEAGVLRALARGAPIDADVLTRALGETFHALGTAVKPYPCCRFAHGTVDLAIAASPHLSGRMPRSVTVRIFHTNSLNYRAAPLNAVDAQFCLPYLTAVGLARGAVRLADLSPDAIRRDEILALAQRLTVVEDDAFSAAFPETYSTTLDIAFEDGSHRSWRSDCPSGDPDAPEYRTDPSAFGRETVAKAQALLAETGFGDRGRRLAALVETLERMERITEMTALLKAPPLVAARDADRRPVAAGAVE